MTKAMMNTSNRWLGLLGAVAVMFSGSVLASTSSGCQNDWIGDGDCDSINNNALCSKYEGYEEVLV